MINLTTEEISEGRKYAAWIEQRLASEDPLAQCAEWTLEMQKAFPELKRVRGSVMLADGLERNHWWLVDMHGEEVDPTAAQFKKFYGAHIAFYCPRDESEPEPTGLCPNCGGYCYTGGTCCSDRCAQQYAAYCMNPRFHL